MLGGVGCRESEYTGRSREYSRQAFYGLFPFLSVVLYQHFVKLLVAERHFYLRIAHTFGLFGSDPYLDGRLFVKLGVAELTGHGVADIEVEGGHYFLNQGA